MTETPANEIPLADIKPNRSPLRWLREEPTAYWVLAAIAAGFAIGLTVWALRSAGPVIVVTFDEGHGLKAGDPLRYRGIDVGQVEAVQLDDSLSGVTVRIRLEPASAGLARRGSRFWIERPQISLARIRSLDTVVGAKYVSVAPGAGNAPSQHAFEGEEYPLTVAHTDSIDIEIRFVEGHGLSVGDPLKHRGIMVGEVTSVTLADELDNVDVQVRLSHDAERLARVGSRFWVERPQLGLQGVRGLETLVGGRYLAVHPGAAEAEPLYKFDGLPQAPPGLLQTTGGLEVLLVSPERHGVEAGAPIRYRGLEVGSITAVTLSPDSTDVVFAAHIEPNFRSLVRENTIFWTTSGINWDVGFSGVELNADTLATIVAGGVSFATPEEIGERAKHGQRFDLHAKAESEWLKWNPRLPSGPMAVEEDLVLPRPQRLQLEWKEKRFSFRITKQRNGLGLLWEDGKLLLPRDLTAATDRAVESTAELTLSGELIPLPENPDPSANSSLTLLAITPQQRANMEPWPQSKTRALSSPEDCWLVADLIPPAPLPAGRLEERDGRWQVDASYPLSPTLHGAAVVAARDTVLLGCLLVNEETGRAVVEPLPSHLTAAEPERR